MNIAQCKYIDPETGLQCDEEIDKTGKRARREYCARHQEARDREKKEKYKASGKRAEKERIRYERKVRKPSKAWTERVRANIIAKYGVKGGRPQCEKLVMKARKF